MNHDERKSVDSMEALKAFHHRPGLSPRIRYLASIQALVALGEERTLHMLFDLALDEKVDLHEIQEILFQSCIFCGFPRTINSFATLRKCLVERGVNPAGIESQPPDRRSNEELDQAGYALFCRIYRFNHTEVLEDLKSDHPELPGRVIRDVYGKTLTRPSLDPKTRELAAIAALTVMKVFPQLLSHIKGGLNLGADVSEVEQVILQMEAFTEAETVRRGLRFLRLGTRGPDRPVSRPSSSPPVPEAS